MSQVDQHNRYEKQVQSQRDFYKSGATRSLKFRKKMLLKLKANIIACSESLMKAMYLDLGKSEYEVITTEISLVMTDINTMVKNLDKWEGRKKVKTNLYNFLGKSYIYREPYGSTLIMSPWNYPFQLSLSPLVGAIGGGNCAIIKTSEFSVHTSKVLERLIRRTFKPEYVDTIQGGIPETTDLLNNRFDFIFFTGSPKVGRIVMGQAAKHLTPLVLELGGKSPIVIHKDSNLDLATKRLIFGKGINAGQTCIAPDYLLIHEDIKAAFYKKFKENVEKIYGKNYKKNKDYGKIINKNNFQRLINYLDDGEIIYGGKYDLDHRHIDLTLIEINDRTKPIMQEEIFGPILPVLSYRSFGDIIETIKENPDPLAMYIFSKNKGFINRLIKQVPFGGGCINDTILHISNENLPFGGRGTSGIGSYHGHKTYDAFTHEKSILNAQTHYDLSLKYPPFTEKTIKYLKKFMYR